VPQPTVNLETYGIDNSYSVIMDDIGRMAVACTSIALRDAGFTLIKEDKIFHISETAESRFFDRACVIFGIGISNLSAAFRSHSAHIDENTLVNPIYGNKLRYDRFVVPKMMPNSAAAWIPILFKLNTQSFTINSSCASGTMAIGEAYRKISDGYCTTAITGGLESLRDESYSIMRGFDTLSTLTKSKDGSPQPFSDDRSGFLFSEGGAAVLILEEYEQAKLRGADIYTEIVGFDANNDNQNIVQLDKTGVNIHNLLKSLTDGIKLDYFNAHGTGTEINDEVESKVIVKLFGEKTSQPYINSTKSILGHNIGASGAIEAAVTAYSIKNGQIHPNYCEKPFSFLNINIEALNTDINYALSSSYGFGGHNAAILFKKI